MGGTGKAGAVPSGWGRGLRGRGLTSLKPIFQSFQFTWGLLSRKLEAELRALRTPRAAGGEAGSSRRCRGCGSASRSSRRPRGRVTRVLEELYLYRSKSVCSVMRSSSSSSPLICVYLERAMGKGPD